MAYLSTMLSDLLSGVAGILGGSDLSILVLPRKAKGGLPFEFDARVAPIARGAESGMVLSGFISVSFQSRRNAANSS